MQETLMALHIYFIRPVLTILFYGLLVYVIMGWLFIAGVVQRHNQAANSIYRFLESVIEPLVRPIRRMVPPMGQLDLSVLILALAIIFTRDWAIPRIILLIPF
ncbi:MAG: YggT family protein [Pseudomonadota bacterium]